MGVIRPTTCWYDGNGNLVKDLTRNISRIEYNPLNLPTEVTFGYEEGKVSYCYSSDGRKLRAVKSVDGKRVTNDYIGNVVYENERSKLLLFDGGYFDCEDAGYHFYVKDYLGNNWAVVAEDGTVEEFNLYTPFGDLLYREGGRAAIQVQRQGTGEGTRLVRLRRTLLPPADDEVHHDGPPWRRSTTHSVRMRIAGTIR